MVKKGFLLLLPIIALFLLTIAIDLPTVTLPKPINIGKLHITKISHLAINWNIGGTPLTKTFNTVLGLDLKGGSELVLQADMSKIASSDRTQALESARTVIENRVNLYGIAEPQIYTEVNGSVYKIIVDLAGVKDLNQAKSLLGETAQLNFYTLKPGLTQPTSQADFIDSGISGKDLQSATVVYQQNSTTPSIQLNFKAEGLSKFNTVAKANIGRSIYIVLDGQIISSPVVNADYASSAGTNPIITGNFTLDNAKQLVTQLDAGALPVPVQIIQENTVSATLGQASVSASLLAGIIGIVIILLFMVWNYGLLGLFADIALLLYILITYALFKTVPVTLSLAGIAGFILSIGMAVDANILIFERTKEEFRKGKEIKQALRLGYKRAWPSIRDSNISSLITTVILYTFGTSLIRGFALTLAIGILVSLFTALVTTNTLLRVFVVPRKHISLRL